MVLTRMRGFSLIELLMVIAIIGVLATVVVVSVSTARNKGADGAIKENTHTVQAEAELYHANFATYGSAVAVQGTAITEAPAYNISGANFFIADQAANRALQAAIDNGDEAYYAIGPNGLTWALAVALKAETGYWCVDAQASNKVVLSTALGGGSSIAICP